ncbi:MAG: A24 family peptidase [Planctomycetaceae bacterium]|jgi:leader peptidase (prepilin peptidase)/N-methyltransferase
MATTLIVSLLIGALSGRLAAGWAARVLADIPSTKLAFCGQCHVACTVGQRLFGFGPVRCHECGNQWTVRWPAMSSLVLGIVFAGYAWLLTVSKCQNVVEVQPATEMHLLRLPFHLVFLFLLTVATLTDLLDYVIPDEVILIGILTAVTGAVVSGDLQIIHVWVNWDAQIPGLHGPYLPDWMKHHHHWHGLIWSLAGMTVGATFIWLVRAISGRILGQPAMGLGDVTLMAMIGAFMGWQPALCAVSIAPVTAVVFGTLVRITTGRSFVAFGPYLAVSAVIVLSTWRWIWAEPLLIRDVFSHWPSVLGLAGGALVALAILLGGLRMFLSVPVDTIRR